MKLSICIKLAVPICLVGSLVAQVTTPSIGILRSAGGTVRPVYGVQANLVLGKPMPFRADAATFSDAGGLIAFNGRIQLVSRNGSVMATHESHERAPLLNIDGDLTTAVAYLPLQAALLHWEPRSRAVMEDSVRSGWRRPAMSDPVMGAFALVHLEEGSFPGTVTSIQAQGAHAARLLSVTKQGDVHQVTVSLDTGQTISANWLPGIHGPAFLYQQFVLFHGNQELEVEARDGRRRTVPISASDLRIERMSQDWVHLSSRSAKQEWALHVNGTELELSELPAIPATGDAK